MKKGTIFILCILFLIPFSNVAAQTLSLSVQDAIKYCLERHPDMGLSQEKVTAARAHVWHAWAPENPHLRWGYKGAPEDGSFSAAVEKSFGIVQKIDFPTNWVLHGKLASADLYSEKLSLKLTRINLTAKVRKAYWTLITARAELDLAEQAQGLAEDFLQKAKRRYEVGETTNLEFIKAKVEKARAENLRTQLENNERISLAELNNLLNRDINAQILTTDSLKYEPLTIDLEEAQEQALKIHPKLQMSTQSIKTAQLNRTLAWGSFLPSIEIGYFQQTLNGNPEFRGAEIGLSIPLWFLFNQRAKIQAASARIREMEFSFRSRTNDIILQVKTAYENTKTAETHLQLFQKNLLTEAEEVYRIAKISYDEGESSYLELLDAQRTFIDVKREYIQFLLLYQNSLTELEHAIGFNLET